MFLRVLSATRRGTKAVLWFLLNSLILFALLNIAIALYADWNVPHTRTIAEIRQESANTAIAKFGIDYFKRLYPNKSEAQVRRLIADQAALPPAIYEPYAEYRDPATTLETLNIHEAGFRLNGAVQGPWPLDPNALNVFVFGGSEILGSGVSDDETIPAAIQALLRERTGKQSVTVYNFAVQAYNSTQDVTYFQNQLRYGNVPDIAIFMEGPVDLERWNGETSVSDIYRNNLGVVYQLSSALGRNKGFVWHAEELYRSLPIVTFIEQRYGGAATPAAAPGVQPQAASEAPAADKSASPDEIYTRRYTDGPEITSKEHLDQAVAGLVTNQAIEEGIARKLNIEPLTVWVPSSLYKYDTKDLFPNIIDIIRRERYGYPIMADYIRQHDMGSAFRSCIDIQEDVHEPLYIDPGHYNKAGNLLVARCAVDGILKSGAFDRALSRKSERRETALESVEDLAQKASGTANQHPVTADRRAPSSAPGGNPQAK